MSELKEQLRSYIDATSTSLHVDDILEVADRAEGPLLEEHRPAPVPLPDPPPPSPPPWRPIGVALAAALVLVVGIAVGLNLVSNDAVTTSDPPTSAPDTTTATPTTAVSTTTAVSPTTTVATANEGSPSPLTLVEEIRTESAVPGLGVLVWERYDGDDTTIPENITRFVDGVYRAQGRVTWESVDGVSWVRRDRDGLWDGFEWVHMLDDFTIATDGEGTAALFERDGESWKRLELEHPSLMDTPTRAGFWSVLESGDVRLIPVHLRSSLGLEVIYETTELWLEWDPLFEAFRLHDFRSESGPTAALRLEVIGATLTLVDEDTGEVVVALESDSEASAQELAGQLQRDGGLTAGGLWVSTGDGFDWVEPPWGSNGQVVESPAGGFLAHEFVYDWHAQDPAERLVSAEVWTSTDGTTWQSHGAPSFVDPSAEHMQIMRTGDDLVASVITGHDDRTGEPTGDTYLSSDGLIWVKSEVQIPFHLQEHEMNFGYARVSHDGDRAGFSVSTDGETWHDVDGPPGSLEPNGPGGGFSSATAAGDLLFATFGSEVGPRTLWVGRFDP